MSPIRRYLRISPHSVLEVRIYLDNPADTSRWLLNPRESDPVLPRVIAAVKPLVVPKLKEEEERNRGRGKGKKKGVRDIVQSDDFEVSIFLTEPSTRHSILMRHKTFLEKGTKLKGNSSKMTGTKEEPFEVVGEDDDDVVLVREEDDREMKLDAITVADYDEAGHPTSKAPNPDGLRISPADTDLEAAFEDQTDQLDAAAITARPKQSQQAHGVGSDLQGDLGADDKKKLVKRRGISKGKQLVGGTGQAMMEEWITSSQMGQRQTTEE